MGILPEGISTYSGDIDSLIWLITVLTGVGFIVSELVLIGFAVAYRRKDGVKASYLDGIGWKQFQWVVYPTILLAFVDLTIDLETNRVWNKIMIDIPTTGRMISVVGEQFQWRFGHPGDDGQLGTDDDRYTINELHVPVNENILFTLEAKDVMHSLFIPNVRFKQDAVPGRMLRRWFQATKVGDFQIACAEICGTGHSIMAARLIVHSKEDYELWLATKPDIPVGRKLMLDNGCLACHSSDGSMVVGPTFKGLFGRTEKLADGSEIVVDEAYIRKSILYPNADIVEGFQSGLMPKVVVTDIEIDSIISYIKTIK
jgi:cytochrome c oxidase subunit 2